MDSVAKIKQWVNEKAPMLASVYENKYMGMLYDRFASLPGKQQKRLVVGSLVALSAIVVLYLFSSYWSLWSLTQSTQDSSSMSTLLLQYQKHLREKSNEIRFLERNSQLAGSGQLKQHLMDMGRLSGISPRMIQVEENAEAAPGSVSGKPTPEVKMKQASAKLQKVTLSQLVTFLRNVEFGQFNLAIPSIKINNDDQLRGYMNVELSVLAYLFNSEESP